jgi:hypothetical protein
MPETARDRLTRLAVARFCTPGMNFGTVKRSKPKTLQTAGKLAIKALVP